jgi:hypothetical protein
MAAIRYKTFDNEKVSDAWYALLTDIRTKDKVNFRLNEGHRTMAKQWYFWRKYKRGQGAIAAYPSPHAPHIRTGFRNHACDFRNAEGVRKAAAKRGVTLVRTVRWPNGNVREEWHLEARRNELWTYYRKWKKRHK